MNAANKKFHNGTELTPVTIPMNATNEDLQVCKDACFYNKECKAFSYKTNDTQCVLRGGDTQLGAASQFWRAYKIDRKYRDADYAVYAAAEKETIPDWGIISDVTLTRGTELSVVDENSLEKCKAECFINKECKGFSHMAIGNDRNKCTLRGGDQYSTSPYPKGEVYNIKRNYAT